METFKAYYTGQASGPVQAFTVTFEQGKPADVPARFRDKVAGNQYFSTDAPKTSAPAPTPPLSPGGDVFEAKHRGGGSYSIMRGDVEVVDRLSKTDAETFNAMSADEKADYVSDRE